MSVEVVPPRGVRHVLGPGQAAAVEIVTLPERKDPALPGEALKLELPKRKGYNMPQKRLLFLAAQEIRLIPEAFRKSIVSKKIKCGASAWHASFSGL